MSADRNNARDSKSSHLQEFQHYIDHGLGEHCHDGVNGLGVEKRFVCKLALANYWTSHRIDKIRAGFSITTAETGAIMRHDLILFSILCYISRPQRLNDFIAANVSNQLPITENAISAAWWTQDNGLRQAFLREQWKFLPLIFHNKPHHRKVIEMEHILPINNGDKKPLRQPNDESAVFRVSLYPCCISEGMKKILSAYQSIDGILKTYYVVLKMFRVDTEQSDAEQMWENEVDAYSALGQCYGGRSPKSKAALAPIFDYITRYLGSFRRTSTINTDLAEIDVVSLSGTHFIMVEYAPGGNLAEFCQKHVDIVTSPIIENRLNLWHHLFELLQALAAVHNTAHGGTYQDVSEENIVYTGGDLSQRDTPCFKLTDFGNSHFENISKSETANGYNFGNRTYMAPECCAANRIEFAVPRKYTKAADIWGLGCLFSEMLIRSVLGSEGLAKYREARRDENYGTEIGNVSQWCFHDGSTRRLSSVDKFHEKIVEANLSDEVSRAVSDLILKFMLQPKRLREDDALTIKAEFVRYVHTSLKASKKPQPLDGLGAVSGPMESPADLGEGRVKTSVKDIISHLSKMYGMRKFHKGDFPHLDKNLRILGPRQHYVLVNDLEDMREYRNELADTVRALTKVLKNHITQPSRDLKLSLLSNPTVPHPLVKSSKLAQVIRRDAFNDTESLNLLINIWFSQLLEWIKQNHSSRSISLYILTNSICDPPLNLVGLTKELLGTMRKEGHLRPDFLSVTIIRFGEGQNDHGEVGKIQQKMEMVMKNDFEASFNPIFICGADDDVSSMLVGGIRRAASGMR